MLTWFGWLLVFDLGLGTLVHLYRSAMPEPYIRSQGESLLMAIFSVIYVIGIFTIGVTK